MLELGRLQATKHKEPDGDRDRDEEHPAAQGRHGQVATLEQHREA
ncbi:hypothetical protein [Gulosibacter sediminis]|nr:hypothetical protein [Gulosibacter sediminis]